MKEFFSLISEEKAGGLFDFDGTLPGIALQFVILMIILKFILYSPVLTIFEQRKAFISKTIAKVTVTLQLAQNLISDCLQILLETKSLVKNNVNKRVQSLDNSLLFISEDFQKRYKKNEEIINSSFTLARWEALEYFLSYTNDLTLQSVDFFTIRSDIWNPSLAQTEKNYFRQIYCKDLNEQTYVFRFDFLTGF